MPHHNAIPPRHCYRNKYEYRKEWLEWTDRLGSGPGGPEHRGHSGVDLLQEGIDRYLLFLDFRRIEETGEKRQRPVSPRDGVVEEGEDEGGGGGFEGGDGAGRGFPRSGGREKGAGRNVGGLLAGDVYHEDR